jgi:hypothetical protein
VHLSVLSALGLVLAVACFAYFWVLKVEAVSSSETSVTYRTLERHAPVDERCESLKSNIRVTFTDWFGRALNISEGGMNCR